MFRVCMTFCLVFYHAMTSCLLGEDKKNGPFTMDSSPVKRCDHKKEVLVFHGHGSAKWLFLKGTRNYYWREPFFTSMGNYIIVFQVQAECWKAGQSTLSSTDFPECSCFEWLPREVLQYLWWPLVHWLLLLILHISLTRTYPPES